MMDKLINEYKTIIANRLYSIADRLIIERKPPNIAQDKLNTSNTNINHKENPNNKTNTHKHIHT